MRQAPGVGLSQVMRAQGKVAGGDGWWRRIIPRIARGSDADLRRRELVVVLVAASARGVCLPFGCTTTTTTTLHAACYKLQPLEVQVCGRGKERSARESNAQTHPSSLPVRSGQASQI